MSVFRGGYSCVGGKAEEGTAQLPSDPECQCCSGEQLQLSALRCTSVLLRRLIKKTMAFYFILRRIIELLEEFTGPGVFPETGFSRLSFCFCSAWCLREVVVLSQKRLFGGGV